MAELFPPVAIRAAEPHEADRLLVEWVHPLGERPVVSDVADGVKTLWIWRYPDPPPT